METGGVRDRVDVAAALREAGLDINREGRDYITVKDPDSGEKIRLKGVVYGADWQFEKFGRAHEGEGRTGTDRDGEGFHRAIADLEQQLSGIIDKRAAYNVGRYGTGDYQRGEMDIMIQAMDVYSKILETLVDQTSGVAVMEREGSRYVTAPKGSKNGITLHGRPAIKLKE